MEGEYSMKHHFRAFLALILVVCLFAGIGGAVCAVDAGDGSGTQYDPEFTLDNGGGYSEPVYRVIVEEGQKDQLKPDRSTATAGSTVTIKFAFCFTADDIKVADKNGKLVEIKKIDDNTYTFVMPASDVNVSGTVEDLRLNDTDHFAYITGYPDGTFRPNAYITRAEFAAIAARFDADGDKTLAAFSDIANHWAKDEISVAYNNGWVDGYPNGTFGPRRNITRAETVTLVNRVLNRKPETEDDLLPDMTTWTDNADKKAWYYLAIQEATNSHYYKYKENSEYEKWTELRETRDWTQLEK